MSNYDEVLQISQIIENDLGAVDILVNNAGLLPSISLREGSPKDIEKIMDVNLMSNFWVGKRFANILLKPV